MQSFTGVALSISTVVEESRFDTTYQGLDLPLHQCYIDREGISRFCDKLSDDERTYLVNCTQARCQICLDLNWANFPNIITDLDDNASGKHQTKNIFTRLRSLQASRSSCASCNLLYRGLELTGRWLIELSRQTPSPLSDPDLELDIPMSVEVQLRPNFMVIVGPGIRRLGLPWVEFYTELNTQFTSSLNPLSIGSAPHVALQPSIEYCVDFIKARLINCNSAHLNCSPPQSPTLPTRVIDVGTTNNEIKLLESTGQFGSYLTLSHCWGKTDYRPYQTTKSNIQQHCLGIQWSTLSKTFQDAILITRQLGYQFLWIDSICIIQDDHQDWETESARMAEVYLYCDLNLAATASSDGRGGCLVSRSTDQTTAPMVQGRVGLAQNDLNLKPVVADAPAIFARPYAENAHDMIERNSVGVKIGAPLLGRSWVYQEIALSPKTVHFHHDELVWECRSSVSCECGYFDWLVPKLTERDSWMKRGWKSPYSVILSTPSSNSADKRAILKEWYTMVIAYSGLHHTFESDRLPALAGLASRVADMLQTRYLAGLWELYFWEGLLWERVLYQDCCRPSGGTLSVSSWSWASIISSDEQNSRPIICSLGEGFSPLSPYNTKLTQADNRFHLVNSTYSASLRNPFGNFSTGVLQVRGAMLPGILEDVNLYGLRYRLQFGNISSYKMESYVAFDVTVNEKAGEVSAGDVLYCLLIGESQLPRTSSWYARHGLVLKNVTSNTYSRVGTINIRN